MPEPPDQDLPTRQFGWWDMFVHPDDDPRSDGGFKGERATLVGFLRDQRLTLELKCAGLDADGMARRSVEPSSLSLLGLVRHLADVERGWFRRRLAGQDAPSRYRSEADPDGAFDAGCTPEVADRGATGAPRSPSPSGSRPRRPTSTSSAPTATSCARCWST